MPEYERPRPRGILERLYRALLYLYPRRFREEFGDAMIEFYRDRLSETSGAGRTFAAWRAMNDLVRNALPARVDHFGQSLAALRRPAPSLISTRREDPMLGSILQDLRYTLRGIRRAPAFALTVLLILAIGIGASVAVFSVVNGVLLKSEEVTLPADGEVAEKTIDLFGLADRVTFAAGDLHLDPVPTEFDVAWLSHVLHSDGPEACASLVQKATAALDPGGLLLIQEFILNDGKDGPLFPALFSLNMLLGTPTGIKTLRAQ